MGLAATFSPMINMIMLACYGLYVVLGIALTTCGIVIAVKELTGTLAWGMIFAGVAMILIGGVCLFVASSQLWFPMMILQLVNFVLFFFILTAGFICLFIGNGYSDPVQETYDEFYDEFRVADGAAGDLGLCYTLADGNDVTDLYAGESWDECRKAYFLDGDCSASDAGAELDTGDIWEDYLIMMGNCTYFGMQMASPSTELADVQTLTSSTACGSEYDASAGSCSDCYDECKENMVQITTKASKPIAVATFAFWLYFVLVALLNNHVIQSTPGDDDEDQDWAESLSGVWKISIMILNAFVALLALVISVIGIAGSAASQNEDWCPLAGTGASCPGTVMMIVAIIGLSLMLCALFSVFGILKSMKMLVIIANAVYIPLCIGFLACVVVACLASGVFGAATTQIDANYAARRDDIRGMQDDDEFTLFCAETCAEGGATDCGTGTDADGSVCGSTDTCFECQNADGAFFSATAQCMDLGSGYECCFDCEIVDVALDDDAPNVLDEFLQEQTVSCTCIGAGETTFDNGRFTLVGGAIDTSGLDTYCKLDATSGYLHSTCGAATDDDGMTNGVDYCGACYYKEELAGDSYTAGEQTVMCASCDPMAVDDDAGTVETYLDRWLTVGGWDDNFKTSDRCTDSIEMGPIDDIYTAACDVDITYQGCAVYTGPAEGYKNVDREECVEEIRDLVEDYTRPLGIAAIVTCVFFIGIMFFTQIAIDIWKAGGDDEDE